MKNLFIEFCLSIFTLCLSASPLHTKTHHTVVVFTDGEISDQQAVSLLVSLPQIDVLGIFVSAKNENSDRNFRKIKSLLNELGADTIKTYLQGVDISSDVKNFSDVLNMADEKITVICLCPIDVIAGILKNDRSLEKISEIVWYNVEANALASRSGQSFGENLDFLIEKGAHVDIISNLDKDNADLKPELMRDFGIKGSTYKISDELAVICLINHELFDMKITPDKKMVRYNTDYKSTAVIHVLSDIRNNNYKTGYFVALNGFPVSPSFYTYDIRLLMDEVLELYGMDEWKACVMTDEFHGHLGVYSIIGAKMGILARDYFGVSTDLLEIWTYAGSVTPYSCFNDGLQVSTGATLGQGKIHLVNEPFTYPKAIFKYGDESILISLKKEYQDILLMTIKKGVADYGLDDEDYWSSVRQSAIKCWMDWDRRKIFEISKVLN